MKIITCIITLCFSFSFIYSQEQAILMPLITNVEVQPLLAQALRLREALSFLGSSLSEEDASKLETLRLKPLNQETVLSIQKILDPYCIAMVDINPEARVKVMRGPAIAKLIQNGWTSYLIKINNAAGVTSKLEVESQNAAPLFDMSTGAPQSSKENIPTKGQAENRFAEIVIYRNRPLLQNLSGLHLEYAVLQIYSTDIGHREIEIGFNIGHGSQDIGFRNTIPILFNIKKAVKIKLKISDSDNSPAIASFTITDGIDRVYSDSLHVTDFYDTANNYSLQPGYRLGIAQTETMPFLLGYMNTNIKIPKRLKGIYPLPSKRIAAYDEYPDFFFQPQVYRTDGEYVFLPPGKYSFTYTRGPEYISQTKEVIVQENIDSMEIDFKLERWIDMAKFGWYSADHHVHAAGCSHYENPEEGVTPADMWRQILGEDVKVAAVLAWGPGWYHQKEYFTGEVNTLSTSKNIMRYDVEVSGFPSSHAGHIVLLNLKEDDYPGTKSIGDWPTWTLPVLTWAKKQGAITGYAHSGWGLEPLSLTNDLPNYILPKMDGIGANEYIVTVTQNVVDFYSLGDTPPQWELNMWYHTLNCNFRIPISGETDFPCISDERVGQARSYFNAKNDLSFDAYIQAIKSGRSYVSDGGSHIIDFSVNGVEPGIKNSELKLTGKQTLKINAKIAAYLLPDENDESAISAKQWIAWHIEKARIQNTRKVMAELIVNGLPVDTTEITANGNWNKIEFNYTLSHSAWIALRILPSSHTNPVFVVINDHPIYVKKSAEWCLKSVDQCWKEKKSQIKPEEIVIAEAYYNDAKRIYEKIIIDADQ